MIHQGNPGYNTAPNPTSNQSATAPNGIYQLNAVNSATAKGSYYMHNQTQSAALNNETRQVTFIP